MEEGSGQGSFSSQLIPCGGHLRPVCCSFDPGSTLCLPFGFKGPRQPGCGWGQMSPVKWVLGSRLSSLLLALSHGAGYPFSLWVYFKRTIFCYVYFTLVFFKKASLTLPCVHFSLPQACEVNRGTNCVTAYLEDCETQLSQAPRQGLLYGVPVSLKECFSYKVCHASVSGLKFSPSLPTSSVS